MRVWVGMTVIVGMIMVMPGISSDERACLAGTVTDVVAELDLNRRVTNAEIGLSAIFAHRRESRCRDVRRA